MAVAAAAELYGVKLKSLSASVIKLRAHLRRTRENRAAHGKQSQRKRRRGLTPALGGVASPLRGRPALGDITSALHNAQVRAVAAVGWCCVLLRADVRVGVREGQLHCIFAHIPGQLNKQHHTNKHGATPGSSKPLPSLPLAQHNNNNNNNSNKSNQQHKSDTPIPNPQFHIRGTPPPHPFLRQKNGDSTGVSQRLVLGCGGLPRRIAQCSWSCTL